MGPLGWGHKQVAFVLDVEQERIIMLVTEKSENGHHEDKGPGKGVQARIEEAGEDQRQLP
jgi:hypothetical protein